MTIPDFDPQARIESITFAPFTGSRPRAAGKNARLDEHGKEITLDLARVTAGGISGYGWSRITPELARSFAGTPLFEVFDEAQGVRPAYRALEFPFLDWLGRAAGRPVFSLLGAPAGDYSVPCYDTSLYIDDLHLASDTEAVKLMQQEAREGWGAGHRAFKVKVGRGALHMPVEEGMRRDAAIVNGIREVIGQDAPLMLDANNGLNVNLTKRLLSDTREAGILWMEEPFHEDPVLYRLLKDWLRAEGLPVLIADGEGDASRHLLEWAARGLVDVVQYDVRFYGFCEWLELGVVLDRIGAKAAPHNYGGMIGNFASCHLAAGVRNFTFVEWDEAQVDGLDTAAYRIADGRVYVAPQPGFGLVMDDAFFSARAREAGWTG